MNREEKLINLLKKYGEWEGDLISEDKMWWPFAKDDVITGKVYETMLELQTERNSLLNSEPNAERSVATEAKSELPAYVSKLQSQIKGLVEELLVENPYPENIFKPLTKLEWGYIKNGLADTDISLDRLSAEIGRKILKPIIAKNILLTNYYNSIIPNTDANGSKG